MSSKKTKRLVSKKELRAQQRRERKRGDKLARAVPSMEVKPTILIVCEGRNTEPSYFNQFRLSTATIKSIGEGFNTVSLVQRAIQLAGEREYEQVWCVFDKDDFEEVDFNQAIAIAENENFGVAYSNQAFEYWLILHFEDHQGGGMHRNDYYEKINKLIQPFGVAYDGVKSKRVSEALFEILNGVHEKIGIRRTELAIKRAERNYDYFDHANPAKEESSTTVFRLVKELLKYV
jgi:hypothetical protein